MSFIQVQQRLVTHRKTLQLARLLNLDRYAIVGRLVALWSWCLDNAPGGRLGHDIDAEMLANVMGRDGEPAQLLEALLTVGVLERDSTDQPDQRLRLHNWRELIAPTDNPTDNSVEDLADDPVDDPANDRNTAAVADATDRDDPDDSNDSEVA